MTVLAINQKVQTPLGEGYVQGAFAVLEAQTETLISKGIAVRLPVNDVTRPHLNQSNCMTSHATVSGVWVFQESEIK
jgi:hypothetical protein